nr:hypothetical protein [Tanacetum cinerariifolium]
VWLAEIDVSILLISASTPVISSELVDEGLNVEAVELGFPLPSGT